MPTTYTLELRTNPLTTHGSHHTTLGTLLHGFLHHQLSTSEQTLPHADRIATKTHNKQREPVSIRILNASRQRITCQITLLDDTWANVYDQAFNQVQPFGNGKPLSGTIHNTQRFTWTLEQLRNRVHELGAPQHLDIEFCSLTSMMHKKTAWDVPLTTGQKSDSYAQNGLCSDLRTPETPLLSLLAHSLNPGFRDRIPREKRRNRVRPGCRLRQQANPRVRRANFLAQNGAPALLSGS
jgi:hypothetical protein